MSAPPPVPQKTRVSPGCDGERVQFRPLKATLPVVKRVRLTPPLILPIVAWATPVPALFAVAMPRLRATTVTFCVELESEL